MTLESLTSSLSDYVSWLYRGRTWAGWELATLSLAVLLLLFLLIRPRRKAGVEKKSSRQTEEYAQAIGAKLAAEKADHRQIEDSNGRHLASLAKKDGKKRRWKQTTEKWRNFRTLVEQLQYEVAQYKQAEENFKQQLAKLKAANERLQQELAEKAIPRPDLDSSGPLARFSRQQDRMLDAR
jgi:hypothetical protein